MKSHLAKRFLLVMLAIGMLLSAVDLASAQRRRTTRRRTTRRAATPTSTPTSTIVSVPLGSNLKVRLNDTLSSKESRVGDKFTVTVIDPVKYNEATINGHIASIIKSGKIKAGTAEGAPVAPQVQH